MRKTILDIPIDWVTLPQAIDTISRFVTSKTPHQITTVNPEFIVESRTNPEFKAVLQAADLSLADGVGIQIAQSFTTSSTHKSVTIFGLIRFYALAVTHLWFNKPSQYHRISGVDLCEEVMKQASQTGWKVFLLGAKPGIAQKAAKIWHNRYQNLQIVGVSSANPDDNNILTAMNQANPDILLVAYGAPKQDLFIHRHKTDLNVPVMIGVGGTFDYVSGSIYRAPRWLRLIGLEWLTRLAIQPKRWRRIFKALIIFPWLITHNWYLLFSKNSVSWSKGGRKWQQTKPGRPYGRLSSLWTVRTFWADSIVDT